MCKMKKELIAHRDPKSPISEVFRTLRTNIQFMNTSKKLKTLLITSTTPGEGKSWIASNLAVTFAQAGKRVILVDADMRKGRQYTIFGALPKPGLSNYLSGINEYDEEQESFEERDVAQYIQKTKIRNLCLMAAGNIPPNPSELLISPKMMKLLDDLKELSDIVIIDGTPCELVTDSVILSRIVDTTVIVTAYETTKKESLQRVITSIKNVKGNIAGVVFNKVPVSSKKYNESYYYGTSKNKKKKKKSKSNKGLFSNNSKREIEEKVSRIYEERTKYEDNENDFSEEDFNNIESTPPEVPDVGNDVLSEINEYIDNNGNNKE